MEWKWIVQSKWFEMIPRVPSVKTDIWKLPVFCIDEHYTMHVTNQFDKKLTDYDGSTIVDHEFRHIQESAKPHTWKKWITLNALLMKETGCSKQVSSFIYNTYADAFNNILRTYKDEGKPFEQSFYNIQHMGIDTDNKSKKMGIENKYMQVFLKTHELGFNREDLFKIKDKEIKDKASNLLDLLNRNDVGTASDMDVLRYIYSLYEEESDRIKNLIKEGKIKPIMGCDGSGGGFPVEMDEYGSLGPDKEERGQGQPQNKSERMKRLARIAKETGLDGGDGEGLKKLAETSSKTASGEVGSLSTAEYKKYMRKATATLCLEKCLKIKDAREKVVRAGLKVEVHKQWRLGDDIDSLNLEETIRRNGYIIPETTTIKDDSFSLPRHTKTGAGTATIITLADMSGSVSGFIDKIAEVNGLMAAYAMEKRIPITSGQFSSSWAWFGDLSYEYLEVLDWCLTQHVRSEGTVIEGILKEIDKTCKGLRDATFIIITDSYIYDIDHKPVMDKIAKFLNDGCVFRIFLTGVDRLSSEMQGAVKKLGSENFQAFIVPMHGNLSGMVLDETPVVNE